MFFLPDRTITNEILALNEEMNKEYLDREFQEVFGSDGLRITDKTEVLNPADFEKHPGDDSWRGRLLEGISKALFHDDNKPEISEQEFSSFFQKDIAERIFDHLAMLARTGYEEGDEPFSINEELRTRMISKLGLKLSRHEKTSNVYKTRTAAVLHHLAWHFQRWLLYDHRGHHSALFGEIYADAPGAEYRKGAFVVLNGDVEKPAYNPKFPAVEESYSYESDWLSHKIPGLFPSPAPAADRISDLLDRMLERGTGDGYIVPTRQPVPGRGMTVLRMIRAERAAGNPSRDKGSNSNFGG
jgi:hypothetical protein